MSRPYEALAHKCAEKAASMTLAEKAMLPVPYGHEYIWPDDPRHPVNSPVSLYSFYLGPHPYEGWMLPVPGIAHLLPTLEPLLAVKR